MFAASYALDDLPVVGLVHVGRELEEQMDHVPRAQRRVQAQDRSLEPQPMS